MNRRQAAIRRCAAAIRLGYGTASDGERASAEARATRIRERYDITDEELEAEFERVRLSEQPRVAQARSRQPRRPPPTRTPRTQTPDDWVSAFMFGYDRVSWPPDVPRPPYGPHARPPVCPECHASGGMHTAGCSRQPQVGEKTASKVVRDEYGQIITDEVRTYFYRRRDRDS